MKTSEQLISSKLISIKSGNNLIRKISAILSIEINFLCKKFILLSFICYCVWWGTYCSSITVVNGYFVSLDPLPKGAPRLYLFQSIGPSQMSLALLDWPLCLQSPSTTCCIPQPTVLFFIILAITWQHGIILFFNFFLYPHWNIRSWTLFVPRKMPAHNRQQISIAYMNRRVSR